MSKYQLGTLLLLIGLVYVVVACGQARPTTTPVTLLTPSVRPASATDQTLIREAITTTNRLHSYHVVVEGADEVMAARVERDFVAPDNAYVKAAAGNRQIEWLVHGDRNYTKGATGTWIRLPDILMSMDGLNDILLNSYLQQVLEPLFGSGIDIVFYDSFPPGGTRTGGMSRESYGLLLAVVPSLVVDRRYNDLGEETVNGVTTRHFSGIDELKRGGGAPISLGAIDVWIDPSTKYIHKVVVNWDRAKAPPPDLWRDPLATLDPNPPTETPLPATLPFVLQMVYSRHNDPAVTIPDLPSPSTPN